MSTANESETPNPGQTQPPASDTPLDQVDRALVNQGDTVRASWLFSLDAVRSNTAYMSPEAKELLVWAFTWCIDPAHPLHFDAFCDAIGYDHNTIYKAYSGKRTHPTAKSSSGKPSMMDLSGEMIKALRNFRRLEIGRAKLMRKKFVITPTAKRIFTACDLARESQSPVMVTGASHIGKTEAFRQYCIDNNHGKSGLVELEAVSGLGGVVRAIAAKVGVSPNGNTPDLIERIKKAITPDMVLIIDEVHLLANTYRRESFFACMEMLRRLYDFTQCGLVLSFTSLGFKKAETERKKELEQIFRRGVHRVELGDMPTVSDVKAILDSWGLAMPARRESVEIEIGGKAVSEKPYEMLSQIAREQGLKAITERLRYAAKFAADADSGITWEHVLRAHITIAKNATAPDAGWEN